MRDLNLALGWAGDVRRADVGRHDLTAVTAEERPG
jgi:hypothetical protein